jgi:PAS domain S-box-containing protein
MPDPQRRETARDDVRRAEPKADLSALERAGVLPGPAGSVAEALEVLRQRLRAEIPSFDEVNGAREHLTRVLLQLPAAVAVARGPEHHIESVNEMCVRVFGRREYVGRRAREVAPEAEAQGFLALMDEVYRTGSSRARKEVRFLWDRQGDGAMQEGFFNFVFQPLLDAAGRAEGVIIFAIDVTDQVRARAVAERAAERVRGLQAVTAALSEAVTPGAVTRAVLEQGVAVLGAAAGAMALVTEDGKAVELVDAIGFSPEQLEHWRRLPLTLAFPLGDAIRSGELIVLASRDEWASRYEHLMPELQATGTQAAVCLPLAGDDAAAPPIGALAFDFAVPYAFDDDDRAFLRALGSHVRQAFRRARLYEAARRELAERRRAEAALTAREAEFRTLAESIPQLAWMAEPNGYIFWYNRRWYEYTGTTPEAMVGSGWQSVLDPTMLPWVLEQWQASLQTGKALDLEFPLRRADGTYRWFLTRMVPVHDEMGRVVRWFGTNTDIQAQREAKAERERFLAESEVARREAEAASRAKSEFLAVMSHELRTPLNAIAGHVQLLDLGIHGPITDAQREALARIDRNQRHLLRLINDVLNLARVETGRVEYQLRDVSLADALADVGPMIEPQLTGKRLQYEVRLPPGIAPVRGDREKLEQILLNLLSNAVKFTEPGGRVTVDATERAGAPGILFLRVSDTGHGIPRDKLKTIFEPFVQVDASRTRANEGVGLGLAISRDLARGMGGDLRARSVVGAGSTFTLALPKAGSDSR